MALINDALSFKEHVTNHTNSKPFVCNVCAKAFKVKSILKNHYMNVHGLFPEGRKGFECVQCGKVVSCSSLLRTHMRSHSSERPFACNICSKKFKANHNLQQHEMQCHGIFPQGRKRIQCTQCGYTASSSAGLRQHMRSHSDERLCKCTICAKAFKWKGALTQHMIVHSQERPFKCTICSKCFKRKYGLQQHMFVHSEERSFQCSTCSKSFKRKCYLKRHVLIHESLAPRYSKENNIEKKHAQISEK